jgi:hypothetical protein
LATLRLFDNCFFGDYSNYLRSQRETKNIKSYWQFYWFSFVDIWRIFQMTVIVVRTTEVDVAVQFLSQFGMIFVQEKHEDGPVHYACEHGDTVFEIYPRKIKK